MKKTGFYHIRVSHDEEKVIETKAEKMGMSPGVFLRWLGLNAKVSVESVNVSPKRYKHYKQKKPHRKHDHESEESDHFQEGDFDEE